MRLRLEYFTGNLQKKNERIAVPDNSSTDFLIEKICERLRAKKSSLSIKYKKDGIYVFNNNNNIYQGQNNTRLDPLILLNRGGFFVTSRSTYN